MTTKFKMNPKVNDPFADIVDAALGNAASEGWGDEEIGKAVKFSAANGDGYELVADGDEIEGVLVAIEPITVNDGFSFGSVQRNKRVVAENAGVGAIAPGALVVAAAQSAIGTGQNEVPKVKAGAPTTHIWRVVSIKTGTGNPGDLIVIERV